MFEILQAYETANNENNKLLRFFYLRHVRRKLKSSFFEKFNDNISYKYITLNKELLTEFNQFFNCTNTQVFYDKNQPEPFVMGVVDGNMFIYYHHYRIKYTFLENTCDIEIYNSDSGKVVLIHPDIDREFDHYFGEIILIAIYNYCVTYIYGNRNRDLYMYDYKWLEIIHTMYFL